MFEDYRIPADDLIGGVEGHGHAGTRSAGWNSAGSTSPRVAAGLPRRALTEACDIPRSARHLASRSAQHQAIQLKLGEMATRLQAARLLT